MPFITIPTDDGSDWLLTSCGEVIIPRKSIEGMTAQEIGRCVQALVAFSQRIPEEYFHHVTHASSLDTLIEYLALYRPPASPDERSVVRKDFQKRYKALLRAVLERDGVLCAACKRGTTLSIDHIIPVSRGGTNALENLQLLCRSCNSKKGETYLHIKGAS